VAEGRVPISNQGEKMKLLVEMNRGRNHLKRRRECSGRERRGEVAKKLLEFFG